MSSHYHYIIAGAGLAGSSLLMRMMSNPFFQDKKILVIDSHAKIQNDKTWCFWEKQTGIFEPIVKHRWNQLSFYGEEVHIPMNLDEYFYKMIESQDLYQWVRKKADACNQITWVQASIVQMVNEFNMAIVRTQDANYTADYVFSSILFEPINLPANQYYLNQHFKGWVIESASPVFDSTRATFMDFRVSQEPGTSFVYVLPTSSHRALIEYTLFTKNLLADEQYDWALEKYIHEVLKIDDYQITHVEQGRIPMTNYRFQKGVGKIIQIGIAGGAAKGSSGYAFQFIQKTTQDIVNQLMQSKAPNCLPSFSDKKFRFYDSVLLHVISKNKMPGAQIFTRLFQKNKPSLVLAFLDNETHIWQDLQIMQTLPMSIFLPAAMEELRLEV